jgi:hypothetical protein
MTNEKQKWINLDTENSEYNLKEEFVEATILAGANTVQKLMAVTYLSQFEDLEGEFATRPIFTPDFQVGIIPYSSELLKRYNHNCNAFDPVGAGLDLKVTQHANTQANIDYFVKEGAQLSRLYQQNEKNLKRFENDRDLFRKVNGCYRRDQNLIRNLAYLTDSLIAQPEEN